MGNVMLLFNLGIAVHYIAQSALGKATCANHMHGFVQAYDDP